MTNPNKAELRRRCEEAKDLDWVFDWMDKRAHAVRQMATPAFILSLLDDCDKAEVERDAALAELEACRKDAARYRWLRENEDFFIRYSDGNDIHLIESPERLDEVLDAAGFVEVIGHA